MAIMKSRSKSQERVLSFLEDNKKLIYKFCFLLTNDQHVTLDIVQAVFLCLSRELRKQPSGSEHYDRYQKLWIFSQGF